MTYPQAIIRRLFLAHPYRVGETYLQHMSVSLGFALRMGLTAFAAIIHALVPALFTTTTSNTIARMVVIMHRRTRPDV